MENCVEFMLSHGDGSPEELIRKLSIKDIAVAASTATAGNNAANNIDADEELARQLAAEDRRSNNTTNSASSNHYVRSTTNNAAAAAARRQQLQEQRRPMASTVTAPTSPSRRQQQPPAGTRGRGTLTTLPSDFLRIPGRNYPLDNIAAPSSSSSSGGTANNNELVNSNGMTDEQLARMLQDELFQEELRNNPEFSHLAHGRYASGGGASNRGRQHQQQQGPDFFEKLSELGDVAKNRFQAFAAGWNSHQNSSGGGGLFGGGNNTSSATNPSPRGNERRGLLSDLDMDEEEEEMDFVGGGRDVELQSVGRSGDKKTD